MTTTTKEKKAEDNDTPFQTAIAFVETARESIRGVVNTLEELTSFLMKAHREHKGTEKEIESARKALKSLQKLDI